MSAFPKADVQNVRIGTDLNVCLWPKADIRVLELRARVNGRNRPKADVRRCENQVISFYDLILRWAMSMSSRLQWTPLG